MLESMIWECVSGQDVCEFNAVHRCAHNAYVGGSLPVERVWTSFTQGRNTAQLHLQTTGVCRRSISPAVAARVAFGSNGCRSRSNLWPLRSCSAAAPETASLVSAAKPRSTAARRAASLAFTRCSVSQLVLRLLQYGVNPDVPMIADQVLLAS